MDREAVLQDPKFQDQKATEWVGAALDVLRGDVQRLRNVTTEVSSSDQTLRRTLCTFIQHIEAVADLGDQNEGVRLVRIKALCVNLRERLGM